LEWFGARDDFIGPIQVVANAHNSTTTRCTGTAGRP
jgi:hypothetical protein